MNIRAFLVFVLLTTLLFGCGQSAEESEDAARPPVASRSVVEAAEIESPPHYEKQIITTAELMKQLMDPMYEVLKDAIEVPPEKRKAWRELYIASFNLAEVNNLLFSREDEKKEYLSTQKWIDESIEAVDLLVKLAESVREQSEYDVMKANFMAVMNNCNQCHREFEPGEIDEVNPPTSWGEEIEPDPDKIRFQ